jgi:hypothetical protein
MRRFLLSMLFLVAGAGSALTAQNLALAKLQANLTGSFDAVTSTPRVASTGNLALRFIPIDWLRLRGAISYEITDVVNFFDPDPDAGTDGTVTYGGIALELPRIFGSSIDITAFSGSDESASSDDLLRTYLKTTLAAPEFHGLPAGTPLVPNTDIAGTGLTVTGVPGNGNTVVSVQAYWNTQDGTDTKYEAMARVAYGGEIFRANAFLGMRIHPSPASLAFEAGATALLAPDPRYELYIQTGILPFAIFTNPSPEKLLYLIFEPRVHIAQVDLVTSFFSSPVDASEYPDLTGNYLGANLLVAVGRIPEDKLRGGISLLGSINPTAPGTVTPLSFSISPFFTMLLGDCSLETTVTLYPLLLSNPATMGEIRLSLKAVY